MSSTDPRTHLQPGDVIQPMFPQNGTGVHTPRAPFLRIGLKVGRKVVFIDPHEIVAVHAEGSYVSLRREAASPYLVREPISQVAEKLQGYGFIRIHRSLLVNMSLVEEIRPHSTGEYFVRIKGGKEYTVTRTYKKNLASLAALWIGLPSF